MFKSIFIIFVINTLSFLEQFINTSRFAKFFKEQVISLDLLIDAFCEFFEHLIIPPGYPCLDFMIKIRFLWVVQARSSGISCAYLSD